MRSLRLALVDAIAGEHRLRRRAIEQQREAERWEQRTRMAEMRDLPDLAGEAGKRAERHRRTAELHERRAAELGIQVERLRAALAATEGHGRAPPLPSDSLDARFAMLAVSQELEQMRATRSTAPTEDEPGGTESNQEQGG